MSDDGWRFVLEGFSAGSVVWSRRHGPPPEAPGCRVPPHILREFGYHIEADETMLRQAMPEGGMPKDVKLEIFMGKKVEHH
jgi:hypothetical protein